MEGSKEGMKEAVELSSAAQIEREFGEVRMDDLLTTEEIMELDGLSERIMAIVQGRAEGDDKPLRLRRRELEEDILPDRLIEKIKEKFPDVTDDDMRYLFDKIGGRLFLRR